MKPHEHNWVSIKPGFPQKICKCGHMKVGTKTVLLSDFIRYTTTKAPVDEGDLGMDVTSGRPQFFQGAAVRNVASLDDIVGGVGNIVADAVFTGGNFAVPGAMSDVTDGIGFVEIVYVVPANGTYYFDVDGGVFVLATFPSDGGCLVGCSVNGVDQGYLIEAAYTYVVADNPRNIYPFRYRMPLTLLAGARTIRLRAVLTGGLPAATIIKTATSPIVVSLVKRP
jgi:hypothetical protein